MHAKARRSFLNLCSRRLGPSLVFRPSPRLVFRDSLGGKEERRRGGGERLGQGLLDGQKVGFAEAFAGNLDAAVRLNQKERRHVCQTVCSGNLVGRVVDQDGKRHPEGGGKSRAVLRPCPVRFPKFARLVRAVADRGAARKGKVNWQVGQETLKKASKTGPRARASGKERRSPVVVAS